MNFSSIIIKNLKYNFTKLTSYIFVNMFVVAVLFTYGSIIFNKKITKDPILSASMDFVNIGIVAILLFSIVFISYTGVYFIKTRGKELGIYLTLGMTKKDLTKMILLESTVIMSISIIAGMIIGFCFSGLFYLVLSNVLDSENLFYISGYTILLSLGVFFIVFICNMIFSVFFIQKGNIMKIIKADKTKGMRENKKIIGFLGIVLFIASTTMLYLIFTDNDIVNSLSNKMTNVVFISVALQFISLYFLIAFGLDFIVLLLSKNKEYYNKNILILSNLKYSFVMYKSTLYVITLLTGMSILFMGIQLSFKLGESKIMNTVLPYDFMIENRENINKIEKDEIQEIVHKNGGAISEFINYEYITNEIYRENSTWLYNYGTTTMIISESEFNKAFKTNIDVNKDELLMVSNGDEDFSKTKIDYDTFLVPDNTESGEERALKVRGDRPTRELFYSMIENDGVDCLTYSKEKTSSMYYPFINSYGKTEYASVIANVIDDSIYNNIRNKEITNLFLFNLEKSDDSKINTAIIDNLRLKNDTIIDKESSTKLIPICKKISKDISSKIMGMFSFTMTFISILFILSSSVVMYYKLVNDIEDEKEKIDLFKKIGLNKKECKNYISKHAGIIFFTPLIIGGVIGLFYNYFFFYNAPIRNYLILVSLVMYLFFILYYILFYFILRSNLIKNIEI